MKNMFQLIKERLTSGSDLCLVTVVASSGSTPRGAGSRMLVGKEGRITGTIGGGAVEYRSTQLALKVLEEKTSREQDFSLTKEDVQNLGMICGGAVDVYFQYMPAGDETSLKAADDAAALYAAGADFWLISALTEGGSIQVLTKENAPHHLQEKMSRHPQKITDNGQEYYLEQIGSSGRVYVLGCGHVGQKLVPILNYVGFRCVAVDDREEFANRELFPTAEEVLLVDFEHLDNYINITENDYCCVMTRGHAYDTVLQAQILRTPACYIGVIGSRSKKAGVFKRLKEEFGCTDEMLERITSPIGLSIKAETPEEIAISIAGQMIEVRAIQNSK